jgi:cyanate permease
MRPAMFPVQIIGVPLAGGIFDATGSYRLAFLLFIALYLLAALLALAFQERSAAVD